jgi:3-methyladenine DNA glycosylase Tag
MDSPEKIKVKNLADYLEVMSKSIFQAGISWKVVESKWAEIREAFYGFDPVRISRFDITDIDGLTEDKRIIRNRRKIEAIVSNAITLLKLDKEYGGFRKYLRSFRNYEELSIDLRKQFKFLGEMGVYHFLWVVGEEVPPWEQWSKQYQTSGAGSSHKT